MSQRTEMPEYKCWVGMRFRCSNPNAKLWKYYGGRGIGFCDRWADFDAFLEDMGRRPTPLHSLDRIDNDLDYSPENCRWATKKEQGRNRRTTIFIDGITQKEYAQKVGVTATCIRDRRKRGAKLDEPAFASISGEKHYNAKLSNEEADRIRSEASGLKVCAETIRAFAEIYGVGKCVIEALLTAGTYSKH